MTDKDEALIWGAAGIGALIGKETRAAFYLLETGRLPAFSRSATSGSPSATICATPRTGRTANLMRA